MRLVYAQQGENLRLAWNLVLRTPDGAHWWDAQVDAQTGELLGQTDWIAREAYRVYPLPFDSPDDGARSLLSGVADATASPFGWHDTNGVAGEEFTDTRGNNVTAQEDQNGNDVKLSDYKGKKVVLYFYPKDLTPGCTVESCNFRDNYSLLKEKGFEVIGVSADDEKKHLKFIRPMN